MKKKQVDTTKGKILITFEKDIARISKVNADGIQIAQACALLISGIKKQATPNAYASFRQLIDNYVIKLCNPNASIDVESAEEEEDDE